MKFKKDFLLLAFVMLAVSGCTSDSDSIDRSPLLTSDDIIVTLEELTDGGDGITTRSYLSGDMKTHLWVEDDEIRVYEHQMVYYDIYKFNWKDDSRQTGVFSRLNDPSNIEAPAFALFPARDMDSGHWDLDRTTFKPYLSVWFRIGSDSETYAYSTARKNGSTTALFYDMLPRWGQVSSTNDSEALQTSLKFLTGVLRLQLANTAGKADLLKVQMMDGTKALDIKGIFIAKVSDDNVIQPDASLAQSTYKKRSGGNELLVDLTGATGSIVVYVPLVTTTVPVDIVVSASNDGGTTWTEFKRFKNKTVTRGKVYGNATEYSF